MRRRHRLRRAPSGSYVPGRLNPLRGVGTANGQAQQDQVWTRKVPSELVAEQPATKRKKKVFAQSGTTVITSTKGQAATAPVEKKAAKGGAFIQVGFSQRLGGVLLPNSLGAWSNMVLKRPMVPGPP